DSARSGSFSHRFVWGPLAGLKCEMRIAASGGTTPCLAAYHISRAERGAFAGEDETRVVHAPPQLREHVTRDEILARRHDRIGLKAMLLRLDRQRQQRGAGED